MRILFVFLLSFSLSNLLYSQKEIKVACIAFYTLQHLFYTLDTEGVNDFECIPAGPNVYNSAVYYDKLTHLSHVIGEIGTDYSPDSPSLTGVSEIENITVLADLVRQQVIAKHGYQTLYQDYKDDRGMDVALLYQPKYLSPDTTHYFSLIKSNPEEEGQYSRDILFAIGELDSETVVIGVNHWPSRSNGEHEMFNPYEHFYRKGSGSTAYRDAWSLFDQMLTGEALTNSDRGFRLYKSGIFNPTYLSQKTDGLKGYPYRSYSFGKYIGGYSDHLPVYLLLVKPKI